MEERPKDVSPSRWRQIQERRDSSKRFKVVFLWEVAMNIFYFDTLREAKKFILSWLSPGCVLDLEFISIYDGNTLIKQYDGDRLFKRFF
jgi:hypothetical protein